MVCENGRKGGASKQKGAEQLRLPFLFISYNPDDMKLYIRNMVCNRCIMVVRSRLEKAGFNPLNVGLGES